MIKEAANSDLMNAAATGNLTIDAYADLQVGKIFGILGETVQAFTADASVTISNGTILTADATSGNVTLTLPAATGNSGVIVKLKRIDSSANVVIVNVASSGTIDGADDITLESPLSAVSLVCNGTAWFVM